MKYSIQNDVEYQLPFLMQGLNRNGKVDHIDSNIREMFEYRAHQFLHDHGVTLDEVNPGHMDYMMSSVLGSMVDVEYGHDLTLLTISDGENFTKNFKEAFSGESLAEDVFENTPRYNWMSDTDFAEFSGHRDNLFRSYEGIMSYSLRNIVDDGYAVDVPYARDLIRMDQILKDSGNYQQTYPYESYRESFEKVVYTPEVESSLGEGSIYQIQHYMNNELDLNKRLAYQYDGPQKYLPDVERTIYTTLGDLADESLYSRPDYIGDKGYNNIRLKIDKHPDEYIGMGEAMHKIVDSLDLDNPIDTLGNVSMKMVELEDSQSIFQHYDTENYPRVLDDGVRSSHYYNMYQVFDKIHQKDESVLDDPMYNKLDANIAQSAMDWNANSNRFHQNTDFFKDFITVPMKDTIYESTYNQTNDIFGPEFAESMDHDFKYQSSYEAYRLASKLYPVDYTGSTNYTNVSQFIDGYEQLSERPFDQQVIDEVEEDVGLDF